MRSMPASSVFKPFLGALLSLILVVQSVPASAFVEGGLTPRHPGPHPGQGSDPRNETLELLDYYPPSSLAKVTDSYLSSPFLVHRSSFPLVINIQDLHCHYGVQKEISQLLEYYASKGISTQFVGVEGAQGLVDTRLMALFPDDQIKKEVSDELMREGILTGMEDYSIRSGKGQYLWGVDDQEAFETHKKLFQTTLADRSQLANQIQSLQARLKALEPTVYSPPMKKLSKKSQAYQEGKLPLAKYLKQILQEAESQELKVPSELHQMQDLLKSEGRSHPALARKIGAGKSEVELQKQTKELLTILTPHLGKEETERLARYAQEDSTVYYLYLDTLAKRHRVLNSCPQALRNFLKYTSGLQAMDMKAFQSKLDGLVNELLQAQSKTLLRQGFGGQAQIRINLVQAQRDLALLKSLLEHKLTEEDLKSLLPRTNDLIALLDSLLALPSPFPLPQGEGVRRTGEGASQNFKDSISEALDFYALALLRDKPLVEQTLQKLRDSWSVVRGSNHESRNPNPVVAVLVTGGFHSEGIKRILKDQGVSYLIVSPHVDSYTAADQSLYLKRLTETTETAVAGVAGDTADFHTPNTLAQSALLTGKSLGNQKQQQVGGVKLFKPDTKTGDSLAAVDFTKNTAIAFGRFAERLYYKLLREQLSTLPSAKRRQQAAEEESALLQASLPPDLQNQAQTLLMRHTASLPLIEPEPAQKQEPKVEQVRNKSLRDKLLRPNTQLLQKSAAILFFALALGIVCSLLGQGSWLGGESPVFLAMSFGHGEGEKTQQRQVKEQRQPVSWKTLEEGVASVRHVLRRRFPRVEQAYERWDELSDIEKGYCRKQIYRISNASFKAWGLTSALDRDLAPYFGGSYVTALQMVYPKAELNSLGFELKWATLEDGIASVRFVLEPLHRHLFETYQQWESLSPELRQEFRENVYRFSGNHLRSVGLSSVLNLRLAPYFKGTHVEVFRSLFPKADLNPLGFELDWSTRDRAIESIIFVFDRERPDLMEKYRKWDVLSPEDQEAFRQAVYQIPGNQFLLWGIRTGLPKYFGGTYVEALIQIFPRAGLTSTGFETMRKAMRMLRYQWNGGRDQSIRNITTALETHAPHLLKRYETFAMLGTKDQEAFRREIYRITAAHFRAWGIGTALSRRQVTHFDGSHINALLAVFPEAGLNPLGFQLDWETREQGIASVRYILEQERPHLIALYERWQTLSPQAQEAFRDEIYLIGTGELRLWGLGPAMDARHVPYFGGSLFGIFSAVFPLSELSPLGFVLQWGSETQGLESMRYILRRERPDLMDTYSNWKTLGPQAKKDFQEKVYEITEGDFYYWGVGSALNRKNTPYFDGSVSVVMQKVFPLAELNTLGFHLDWSDQERAIASINFVLERERPDLMERYSQWDTLDPEEQERLRREILDLTLEDFNKWGLWRARHVQFLGSFKGAVRQVFKKAFFEEVERQRVTRKGSLWATGVSVGMGVAGFLFLPLAISIFVMIWAAGAMIQYLKPYYKIWRAKWRAKRGLVRGPSEALQTQRLESFRALATKLGIPIDESKPLTGQWDIMEVATIESNGEPEKVLRLNPQNLALLSESEAADLLHYHEKVHFSSRQRAPTTAFNRFLNEIPAYAKFGLFTPLLLILKLLLKLFKSDTKGQNSDYLPERVVLANRADLPEAVSEETMRWETDDHRRLKLKTIFYHPERRGTPVPTTKKAIELIQEALRRFGLEKRIFLLYGSFAEGRQHEWSDLDLFSPPRNDDYSLEEWAESEKKIMEYLQGKGFLGVQPGYRGAYFSQSPNISSEYFSESRGILAAREDRTKLIFFSKNRYIWYITADCAKKVDLDGKGEVVEEIVTSRIESKKSEWQFWRWVWGNKRAAMFLLAGGLTILSLGGLAVSGQAAELLTMLPHEVVTSVAEPMDPLVNALGNLPIMPGAEQISQLQALEALMAIPPMAPASLEIFKGRRQDVMTEQTRRQAFQSLFRAA